MDRQAIQERFGIRGDSPGIRHVIDRVRQVARTNISVLIEGESGVGKELVSRAIHELSDRRHKPLVIVNCGAIPEGLLESELFGAEKGAYTGAVERRTGYFEEANGGSIFLDEIGEMPASAQVRLLRVLETGEFSRVGSSTVQKVSVRVIAATNKNLGKEVQAGEFREDLYYRLSTVVVRIPPLRERKEDILPLFEHFVYQFAQKYNARNKALTDEARKLLREYHWPGNVRELRNVAEQVVVLVPQDQVSAETLRPLLRGISASGGLTLARASGEGDRSDSRERELLYRALLELRLEVREVKNLLQLLLTRAHIPMPPALAPPAPETFSRDAQEGLAYFNGSPPASPSEAPFEDVPFEYAAEEDMQEPDGDDETGRPLADLLESGNALPTVDEAERTLITEALKRFDGNRRQTAKALGISERTLYRKIKELQEKGILVE